MDRHQPGRLDRPDNFGDRYCSLVYFYSGKNYAHRAVAGLENAQLRNADW